MTLIEFLNEAKKLLELTRQILIPANAQSENMTDNPGKESTNRDATATPSLEYSYTVWQHEMEKAYDALIEVISPYLTILNPEQPNHTRIHYQFDDQQYDMIRNINLKRA